MYCVRRYVITWRLDDISALVLRRHNVTSLHHAFSGTPKGCALRATLLSPLTFLSPLLLVGTQCIASEEFCCRGEVCSPENTSSVGAPLAGALFVLIIVNVPVIAVGCGPMCPPEKKSSVRPLPNPPQREGTMIPTKAVSHRVLSVFRALNQQSVVICVICGSLTSRNYKQTFISSLKIWHYFAQYLISLRSKLTEPSEKTIN